MGKVDHVEFEVRAEPPELQVEKLTLKKDRKSSHEISKRYSRYIM